MGLVLVCVGGVTEEDFPRVRGEPQVRSDIIKRERVGLLGDGGRIVNGEAGATYGRPTQGPL